MRTLICVAVLAAFIQSAAAHDAKTPAAPDAGPTAEAKEQLKVKLIQQRLEAAGFVDVHISPQVHVVQAKDKDGKQIVLVVESQTMVAVPLKIPVEPSTTGSNSEDEGEDRL